MKKSSSSRLKCKKSALMTASTPQVKDLPVLSQNIGKTWNFHNSENNFRRPSIFSFWKSMPRQVASSLQISRYIPEFRSSTSRRGWNPSRRTNSIGRPVRPSLSSHSTPKATICASLAKTLKEEPSPRDTSISLTRKTKPLSTLLSFSRVSNPDEERSKSSIVPSPKTL